MWCPAPLGARVTDRIAPPSLYPDTPDLPRWSVRSRDPERYRQKSPALLRKEYAARRDGQKAATVGDRPCPSVGIPVSPATAAAGERRWPRVRSVAAASRRSPSKASPRPPPPLRRSRRCTPSQRRRPSQRSSFGAPAAPVAELRQSLPVPPPRGQRMRAGRGARGGNGPPLGPGGRRPQARRRLTARARSPGGAPCMSPSASTPRRRP